MNPYYNIYSIYSIIAIFLISIFFNSCDDKNLNESEPVKDYLPLSIGNYWIFNTYQLDSKSNRISGTEQIDSLAVVDFIEKSGRKAYILIKFTNSTPTDTNYISKVNNLIFELHNENSLDIPTLGDTWVKVADFGITEWNAIVKNITNYPFDFDGKQMLSTYHHTINATASLYDSITFSFGRIFTKSVTLKHDSRLYFYYKFKPDNPMDSVLVNQVGIKYYLTRYAENIGFALIQLAPYGITTTTNPKTSYSKYTGFNGTRSDLLRWKVE